MPNRVDERIVEMQFNNRQFESGIKTSLDSVNNLKKGLNFDASTKSLENLDRASKSFSLEGIARGVDTIASRFTNLGIIGMTTIQNLTNSVVNFGKNLVTSLTIAPISSGLKEYETKMGAIQTILTNTASKGTKLEDVNAVLEELNLYADKTIYNFEEMTRNIGTFTAAGVDLKTSATAIKGIANLAAGSGSSAEQASTAMYQLSQALAAGKVSLMDWNSVVNAGMGGELFQTALKKTAKEMGIVVDTSKPFRETLQDDWLTAKVLTKTLSKFAEDESLVKAATQVKTFTQLFDTMKESVQSGWAVSWENIIGDKEQSSKTLTAINDAFGALIGPATDARNEMLKFWNANGGRDALIEGLANAFEALGAILKPIGEAFREVFPAMTGERLVELTKGFRDFTANLKIGDGTANNIRNTFNGLFSIFSIIIKVITTVVKLFGALATAASPLVNVVLYLTGSLGYFFTSINNAIQSSGVFNTVLEKMRNILTPLPNMFTGFDKVATIFSRLAESIGKAFGFIKTKISNVLANIDFDKIFTVVNYGLLTTIILGISKFVNFLTDIFSNNNPILQNIRGMFDSVRGSLEAYQTNLKSNILLKIAIAVGILALSMTALSKIDPERLGSALAAMTMLFGELIGSMVAFEKLLIGPGFKAMFTLPVIMIAMALAISILASAMLKLSKIDWNGVAKGLIAVAGLSAILVISAKALSANQVGMMKGALGLILFSTALLILVRAVEKLSKLNVGELAKGLIGIGVLMAELVVFMKLTDLSGVSLRSTVGILIMAAAISQLANVVKMLGGLDFFVLVQGLEAMAILLAEIILFTKLIGNPAGLVSTSAGLLIMAVAIDLMAVAIRNLGTMSLEQLGKGLGALAAALIIMGVAMKAMQNNIAGAAAIIIMAGAIAILAPALMLLGSMSLKQIGKSLLMLAGVFVVLGLAALVLAPLTPVILSLAGALLLFGIAIAAIGGGILALSIGLTGLAASGAAGVGALVVIVKSLIDLIPYALQKFGEALVAMAKVIGDNAPAVIDAIMKLIFALLDAILVNLPKLVQKGVDIIVAIVKGITDALPRIIQAGFDLILAFVNGLANGIRANTDPMIKAMENLVDAMIEAGKKVLWASVPDFVKAGLEAVGGFLRGIRGRDSEVKESGRQLANSALVSARKTLDSNSPSREFAKLGGYAADGFALGLTKCTKVIAAGKDMGTTAMDALRSTISSIADIVNSDMDTTPTIRPVIDLTDVKSGVNTIDSLLNQRQGINVSSTTNKTASIATKISNQKTSKDPESQNGSNKVVHTGTIRVEGVDDKGKLRAVIDLIKDELGWEARMA